MANVVEIGFDPIWSAFNLTGVAAGGAMLYSYQSLLPMLPQVIYQDAALTQPYPNPILFDLNGNAPGPFYFVQDTTNPTNLYNLYLYQADGNLIWNVNNYFPTSTTNTPVETNETSLNNLIVNNVLYRNLVSNAGPLPTQVLIAPGTHEGLVGIQDGNYIPAPDIVFYKGNTNATDSLAFTLFALGSTPFIMSPYDDVTPVGYLNYTCTVIGATEAIKVLQFPITAGIQNLTGQKVTFTIWARSNGGNVNLPLTIYQYYGAGSGSTSLNNPIGTCDLTSSWNKFIFTITVPSVTGGTTGNCHNDGVFFQINYPLSALCNIDIALPSMFMGIVSPMQDFTIYDDINAVISAPRTGDIKMSISSFMGRDWIAANGGGVGDSQSYNAGVGGYAGNDSFPLFNLFWNLFKPFDSGGVNPIAQMYNNSATPIGYGASSVADYSAHNSILITRLAGQVIMGTVPVSLYDNVDQQTFTASAGVFTVGDGTTSFFAGAPVYFTTTGTLPAGLTLGKIYYVIPINTTTFSVALTYAQAIAGTPAVNTTTAGTGVHTVTTNVIGSNTGQYSHTQLGSEVGVHHHTGSGSVTGNTNDSGVSGVSITAGTPVTDQAVSNIVTGNNNPTGGSPFNIVQPAVFINMFIKL